MPEIKIKTFDELKQAVIDNPTDYEHYFTVEDIEELEKLFEENDLNLEDAVQYDNIFEYLEDVLDIDKTVKDYNEYIEENSYEETVYSMDDFDEICSKYSPSELIDALDKHFSLSHDYFYFTYDRIKSFDEGNIDDVIADVIGSDAYTKFIIERDYSDLLRREFNTIVEAVQD